MAKGKRKWLSKDPTNIEFVATQHDPSYVEFTLNDGAGNAVSAMIFDRTDEALDRIDEVLQEARKAQKKLARVA